MKAKIKRYGYPKMGAVRFRDIRGSSSLSEIAEYLRVDARTVRRYEDGTREVSGPVSRLMDLYADAVLYRDLSHD